MPEGSHSDILETEHGYHIFKTAERKAPSEKTFEQAKNQIHEMLFRKKAHERFVGWMEELKKKAYVSVR
jgi:parvulin-like peptidyl-prolyl isomerase